LAEAHTIVLATAGIVAANEALLAPLAGYGTPWKDFNWRLLPATAITTLVFVGLEKIAAPMAKGLAVLLFVTVMVAPLGKLPPPAVSAAIMLGYQKKPAGG
jgi:hypothetical protein